MEKIFKGLNDENLEIKIFRKIIKIKHDFKVNFLFTVHSQYSCYDLCVLLTHLKKLCSDNEINNIKIWINKKCEYLDLENKNKPEGTQISLF